MTLRREAPEKFLMVYENPTGARIAGKLLGYLTLWREAPEKFFKGV